MAAALRPSIGATAPAQISVSLCRSPRWCQPRSGSPRMPNAYTVLVVDDEPPILRFLRTSLSAVGYRVITAEDAAAALAIVKAEKPDVVVLDLGLPDRSGFEVIADIRKHSPVPIIVLLARAD